MEWEILMTAQVEGFLNELYAITALGGTLKLIADFGDEQLKVA